MFFVSDNYNFKTWSGRIIVTIHDTYSNIVIKTDYKLKFQNCFFFNTEIWLVLQNILLQQVKIRLNKFFQLSPGAGTTKVQYV